MWIRHKASAWCVMCQQHRRLVFLYSALVLSLVLYSLSRWQGYLAPLIVLEKNKSPYNRYGDNGVQRLPDVIIVGVMKAGTFATLHHLSGHPDVEVAADEGNFFSQEAAYRRGLDFYRSIMPYVPKTKYTVVAESCPNYFEPTYVPERIKSMNSSVKIVVVVRDPVKRAQSDYARTQRAARERLGLNIDWISFEVRVFASSSAMVMSSIYMYSLWRSLFFS